MGGMGGMGGMQNQGMQQGMLGRIQWVSNAALTAVASEKVMGPTGKPESPFKIYAKDMTVTLIAVPILITLSVTGVLTQFGFLIGDMLCGLIETVGGMI